MNRFYIRVIVFLILNFSALFIGGLFTSDGVSSSWFSNLNQAPWNPPSWAFGAAWTLIMICFAFYMASLYNKLYDKKRLLKLYLLQLLLNSAWNPAFFYMRYTGLALLIICALTVLIGYFLFQFSRLQGRHNLLSLPYFLWLIVATSLNTYIFFAN